ncbi:MAG: hypothetical protein ABJH45_10190 [Paracoccaceae bacterium]
MLNSLPHNEVQYFSDRSFRIISSILVSLGVEEEECEVDKDILVEVAEFFLRDIYRIDKQQRGSVSIAKWAGYWAFWVRKLKPISMINLDEGEEYASLTREDAVHINEIVALQFSLEIVAKYRESGGLEDLVFRKCTKVEAKTCDGVDCFWRYATRYLNFADEFYSQYLTYSMRNRTFGPHHFALLLENIIFAACSGLEDTE